MKDPGTYALRLIAGAKRVIAGSNELRPYLENALPVADDNLDLLDPFQRIASIALLKRFEQLQDQSVRLARIIIEFDLERTDRVTMRDIANAMEKRFVVEDADDWISLLNLRNQLVHEYPIGDREQVDRVNECWAALPRLIEVHDKMLALLVERGVQP